MLWILSALAAAPTPADVMKTLKPCGELPALESKALKGELDVTQKSCLTKVFASPQVHKAIRWKAGYVLLRHAHEAEDPAWLAHAEAMYTMHADPKLARVVLGYIGETEKNLVWKERANTPAANPSEVAIAPPQ